MEYETSYDTGLKPFNHDKHRGKWATSKDFFFACAGHVFKADAVYIMPIMLFEDMGFLGIIPYLFILGVCVVPLVFLQSFLGQFSGTGFISVFRISPLFKGIGYVSLVVNFLVLAYYGIFSAMPMFYFFHSLRPNLPWSCENTESLMTFMKNKTSFCDNTSGMHVAIPSVEFFINHLTIPPFYDKVINHSFSLQLMLCCCIIWGIVAFVVSKPTELIGKIVKYSFFTVVAIMSICLLRFIFLPGALAGLGSFIWPSRLLTDSWIFLPSLALSTLGPGWGSILTMASFNHFKTDIFDYSWLLCLTQMGLMAGMAFISIFLHFFMEGINPHSPYIRYHHSQWAEFLSIPTALSYLEIPHFWSLIFFGMWILGSLNILIVQLLSLLTSLFDEFEELRESKRKITFGAAGLFTVTSMIFCSTHGYSLAGLLTSYAVVIQVILNLFLLLVVLWIYGRERFQRDLNFMTSRTYPTWMVNIVRFVAPFIMFIAIFLGWLLCLDVEHDSRPIGFIIFLIATFIFLFVWCLIPGYCIIKIKQTTGIIGVRIRRCLRPTDWYPADPVYKQTYEDTFSSTDISHQLTTATME